MKLEFIVLMKIECKKANFHNTIINPNRNKNEGKPILLKKKKIFKDSYSESISLVQFAWLVS